MLLDEHIDWRVFRSFGEGFEVDSVDWRGWKGKKNGELLEAAQEAGFDVLLTTDQGIPHQQNLSKYPEIAVVSVRSPSNRRRHVAPIVEGGMEKIATAPGGEVTYLP